MSTKPETKEITAESLAALVTDLNAVLKPKPLLDPAAKDLQAQLVEMLPDIEKGDKLADASWATLKALGWGDKPTTAPAKAKKAATPKKPAKTVVKKDAIDDRKITLLVKENPKRAGSASAKRFAKYKNGMTIAEAVKAGVTRGDIIWDKAHGFIKVS